MTELKIVMKGKKGTSPGPDDICYTMIEHLPYNALEILLDLINRLWEDGICPNIWQHSVIILLLKKPDLERNNPSAYRPISLTSHLCKIMERVLNHRLRWWLESNRKIQCQSGFRAKRSTKDCILRLHDDIYKALPNKRSTL